MSYRSAKRWRRVRMGIGYVAARIFTWATSVIYGVDGFRYHSLTHLIADMMYRDLTEDDGFVCPVCTFWRGVVVGVGISVILCGITWFIMR